jgi:two-component system sensor histidine kinase PilS (NtrC family)
VVTLDVGTMVSAAATLAASHPDRGDGVNVTVVVDADTPSIEGDEDLLHRAVFNLVLNAVQAVGSTGHVQVRVQPASADAHRLSNGAHVAISVSDDGGGIPEDVRDRLFEPFVSGKPGGTGLGLPVVHRAVEAHRGVVLVDALSPGTRFTVLLPATPVATPSYSGIAS